MKDSNTNHTSFSKASKSDQGIALGGSGTTQNDNFQNKMSEIDRSRFIDGFGFGGNHLEIINAFNVICTGCSIEHYSMIEFIREQFIQQNKTDAI